MEKGDEVANLVDSSLMEKRTERPLVSRANTGSSQNISVFLCWPSHTSNLPPPLGQKNCLRVDRSTPQTDRHRLVRERGDKQIKRRCADTAAICLLDACLGGSAQSAGSRAMVDGGGVWSVYPYCRVYAAAERTGAGSTVPVAELRPWSRGTLLEARVLAVGKNKT